MKKVSVIIPAFNKYHYTKKTIESILNQSYQNIEIILVNDGSNDKTYKLEEEYGSKIKYYEINNSGASKARNLGIEKSEGDYLTFIDCDDVFNKNKIEISVDVLEKNSDYSFVYTDVYFIDSQDKIIEFKDRIKEYPGSGNIAKKGKPCSDVVNDILNNDFFKKPPPKSLDRNYFNYRLIPKNLSPENGAATAVDLVVKSIKNSEKHMPSLPRMLLVCGGGRKNKLIMSKLSSILSYPVKNIDDAGFRGDFIEAEAFAYLAVRKIIDLPTTFPETTGCKFPTCGGKITYYK